MSDLPQYVLDRVFDAPRDLVWRTWTEKEYLGHWYGPGVETVIHALDVRPGGQWLVEMKGDNWSSFQRADYTEVEDGERLVWLQSMTDAAWNITTNPKMPDWPRVLHTDVTFADEGSKTRMRLLWTPHEATEAEIAMFTGAIEGLGRGWGAGMDLLEGLLAELQSN